jgi:hypothetical protein
VLSRLYGDHVAVLRVHGRVLVGAGAGGQGEEGADGGDRLPHVEVLS